MRASLRVPFNKTYMQVLPKTQLAPFIHSHHLHQYSIQGDKLYDFSRFPGGNIDLVLQFGSPQLYSLRHGPIPALSVFGLRTHVEPFIVPATTDLIIVHFHPGGGSYFFPIDLDELTDSVVSLDQLWPESVIQQIYELTVLSRGQRLERLEQILLHQMRPRWDAPPYLFRAVSAFHRFDGQISIQTVAQKLDISASQLERSFQRYIGVTPKSLARIIRFQMAVWHIRQCPPQSWANFALQHGYADQAHLIREFAAFINLTPTEFFRFKPNAEFIQYNDSRVDIDWGPQKRYVPAISWLTT